MAKKIQSNICGTLNSFRSVATTNYGYDTLKVAAPS